MTGPLEPQLETADPGEQTCNQHDVELHPDKNIQNTDGTRTSTMTLGPRSTAETPTDHRLDQSIDDLHRVCGVYTMPVVASRILDAVGWRAEADLSRYRLLEPSAGSGEFVVQAAERLIASCRSRRIKPTIQLLGPRITAFELHTLAATGARRRVHVALQANGVHHSTASACAAAWIRNADFLLSKTAGPGHTHVVGNPPYIRWSKIPSFLRSRYEERLPRHLTRGDLFLPFLDRSFDLLEPNGKCGFLCSDRWLYMAFAERFRQKWLPWLDILSNDPVNAAEVFDRRVATYPTMLIASRRATKKTSRPTATNSSGLTLEELQYVIKAGPALGHTPAFVIGPDEDDVEPELLRPWIDAPEILEGSIEWEGRRVVTMFDNRGNLLNLQAYPRLSRRLKIVSAELTKRYIVQNGAPWYRTIDRVRAIDWLPPKLLVPELAKTPRVALDRSGAVPSHGVYAIFAPRGRIEDLYETLRDGGLARALDGIAPRLKGNYTRCYKRFLSRIRIRA